MSGEAPDATSRRARRWATAALVSGGLSAALFPILGCLLLVTMGAGMFLFPVLLPGFVAGTLCALRARSIESEAGALTARTRGALRLNQLGLAFGGFLSLVALGVLAVVYLGRH